MKLRKYCNRTELMMLFGLIISIILGSFALFSQQCQALRTDVIRLHILANSDSQLDQDIKLKVRDNILAATGDTFAKANTRSDAIDIVKTSLPTIEKIAVKTLSENGFNLPVHAQLCNMYFNTRNYGEYTLPAGMYDAVRVTIGSGLGHNWWCVIYPPICVPAAQPKSQLTMKITELDSQPLLIPKLAVVELFENIREKLCGDR